MTNWESSNAQRLSKEGIRPSGGNVNFTEDSENYLSNSKYSPESFKYWERDLEVIKKLGLRAYRLSVEWSVSNLKKESLVKRE